LLRPPTGRPYSAQPSFSHIAFALASETYAKAAVSRRTPNGASPRLLWSAGACSRFLLPDMHCRKMFP